MKVPLLIKLRQQQCASIRNILMKELLNTLMIDYLALSYTLTREFSIITIHFI